MTDSDMHRLATYNAEINRGILHGKPYRRAMAKLQRQFNLEHEAIAAAERDASNLKPQAT